ncbi:unnamed protein product [Rotaria sp. Silwood2]|nr:unnamed protein product [Rotaria sp. Silwood2]CAF3306007.1 unnamed protein product [Rotaria sp. Silwood2]CAF4117172.1 unnamed protein product [Rotaria sp. Silwood2]CAF4515471.1 unnamed protein product [Rotaria sp. Silwood2]
MRKIIGRNKIDIDEITCPITKDIFVDPVMANDGFTYERAAITKWILENGTSPCTREPLDSDDLLPHDRVRVLAKKYRNTKLCGKIIQCCHCIRTPKDNHLSVDNRLCSKNIRNCFIICIYLLIIIAGLIIVIVVVRTKFYSAGI